MTIWGRTNETILIGALQETKRARTPLQQTTTRLKSGYRLQKIKTFTAFQFICWSTASRHLQNSFNAHSGIRLFHNKRSIFLSLGSAPYKNLPPHTRRDISYIRYRFPISAVPPRILWIPATLALSVVSFSFRLKPSTDRNRASTE